MSENIIQILKDSQAMLTGHFLLSSGKHSSQYFQCARLLQYPDRSAAVLGVVARKLNEIKQTQGIDFDCIIGPAMGGIVVAYELGRQLNKPAFFTERNDEGKMTLRRGFELKQGSRVIIAEDVVTTGKSAQETAECIEALGGKVAASICIVDRRPENAENPFPWPLYPAVRIPAVLWDAGECPLCKESGEPPVKPGSRKVF